MASGERAGGSGIRGRRDLEYAQRSYGMVQLNQMPETHSFTVIPGHKKGDLKEQLLLESGEGAFWMVVSLVSSKSTLF